MADIDVRPVHTRRELNCFIKLPRQLYQGMAGFVPPFDMEQVSLLHPRQSAVFRHADVQYFIAWRNNTPVGRIAAIMDHRAIEQWQERIGQFGALDALPEADIVDALLAAAEDWLKKQHVTRIRGPVTLSGNAETGTMIEGQTSEPMIAMPWHPPELDAFIRQAGYHKTEDLFSYRLDLTDETEKRFKVPNDMKPGKGRLQAITVRSLSKKEIVSQGEILRQLYNDAWSEQYNFVPMQDYEMQALIAQIKPLLRPEHYVQIDQNGEPVAMAMVLPNIYDITSDLGGSPSITGWVKFAYRLLFHRFHSARVILLGVTRKLRGTMMGALLPSLAIVELFKRRHTLPYKWVELGWILESNTGMRNLAESLVSAPHKKHRLYEKDVTQDATTSTPSENATQKP
ncbi:MULTISPECIES: hypothetical protein [unclassified Saccharibacter]|uniref:hypothetical protein n=1 Tax=unclassified Saccharibacter TaxID=2648722 RepID=UPI0013251081|nr:MULTISPECIES: hypothetical protein [unclassified Saccharibacter]MXV35891.1 hypothetical protein [Saccharibacter sp. EH611]MXV58011.1 hypothetical protein [Saccharibacter sp. EH70]MXV66249.1 hypothetical protein [Saccharibacter sp. EH60]